MAWFIWNGKDNKVTEVSWTLLEHHPDFVYENGVHLKKFSHHTELWVESEDENMAVTKMLVANPDFRDARLT